MLLHLKVKGQSRVAGGPGARLLRGPTSCPGLKRLVKRLVKRLAPCELKSASRSRRPETCGQARAETSK